mgnify:CR=1 FL=1
MYRVLTINPGSTSTKIGVYDEESPVFVQTLHHSSEELKPFKRIADQYALRRDTVLNALKSADIAVDSIDAVVGRGGILPPFESGTYHVNQKMIDYLNNPAPPYPMASRRAREQGTVMLRVLVSPAGTAQMVELEASGGFSRLDHAARDAVRRWRFVPASQSGRPVTAWVLVPVIFSLAR